MSRTVIGYRDGRPVYRDEGPAVARVQGFGGAAIGTFEGVTLTAKQRRANEPKKVLPRAPLGRESA